MANFAGWEEFLGGFHDRASFCGEFPHKKRGWVTCSPGRSLLPLASIRRAVSTRQIAITDDDDLPCCLNNIQGTKNSGRKKKKLRAHRFDLDSAKGCSAQVGQHYTFKMATGITSNLHWR